MLYHKTKEGSADEPLIFLKKIALENTGIGIFVARNRSKNEPITTYIGAKTNDEVRHALEVLYQDSNKRELSVLNITLTLQQFQSSSFLFSNYI